MENKERLIDANALLEKMQYRLPNEDNIAVLINNCIELVKGEIVNAPTVDAVKVVHGRWIKDGDVVVCSNCGEEHCWDEYRATYCEDCGAKMDGERRENESS